MSFLATRAGNVIRAGVPPDRIRDVVVVVPPLDGGTTSGERGALERLTARDLAAAEDRAGRSAAVIVLTPFDEVDRPTDALVVDPSVPVKDVFPVDPLEPSSAAGIAWASIAALLLLTVVGYGWARIGLADTITAAAAAPAIGAAMLILVGDRARRARRAAREGHRGARRLSARRRRRVPGPVRPRAARRIGFGATGPGATSRVARSRPA